MSWRAVALGIICFACDVAAQSRIIQLGDSWAQLSAETLSQFCAGSTVANRGVSSSTALEWAAGTSCPSGGDSSCSMADAFSSDVGYTHAVVSIGGNDFLDTAGCSMTSATIQSRVSDVLKSLRSSAPSGIKIVLVAYCTPVSPYSDCTSPSLVSNLNAGIAAAAAQADDVTFVDSAAQCGGSATVWSPGDFHVDPIHLNPKGYCRVWTMPVMQEVLGCRAAAYDCSIPARVESARPPFPPPPPAAIAPAPAPTGMDAPTWLIVVGGLSISALVLVIVVFFARWRRQQSQSVDDVALEPEHIGDDNVSVDTNNVNDQVDETVAK